MTSPQSLEHATQDDDEVSEVTSLLREWNLGDAQAFGKLFTLFEADLRRIAHYALQKERPGHILQTTALMNDLYLKWCVAKKVAARDTRELKRFAGRAMRQILLDYARKYKPGKESVPMDAGEMEAWLDPQAEGDSRVMGVAFSQALDKLGEVYPERAVIVELKLKAGFTLREIAECLNIPAGSISREWTFCKEYLTGELLGTAKRELEKE